MSGDAADRGVGELAVLLEVALSIGGSLDLHRCCATFLRTLMARKNLVYAAVWVDAAELPTMEEEGFLLVYGSPHVHIRERLVPADAPIAVRSHEGPFAVSSGEPGFDDLVHEARISGGTYAVFPLDGFGFLKLYAARPRAFGAVALSQIQTLVRTFASSLRGCLAHARVVHQAEERQRLEEQLRQAHKLEAVGQLAGGIAHDFNNLLAAISGFAELLTLPGMSTEQANRYGERILSACDRASALTSQLLAFSRRTHVTEQQVRLDDLTGQVAEMLTRIVDPRVPIRLELAESCPPVVGDPAQLHALILNLALNARDAQPDGGSIRLVVRPVELDDAPDGAISLSPGHYVELEVVDEGHGMDEETRARAFEPFFTTKPVGEGSGLGLAVAYGTVRAHGGAIELDSEPDRGTRVRVLLPVRGGPAPSAELPRPSLRLAGGRVLVVDDEPLVRQSAERMIHALGFEVTAVADGQAAVEAFVAAETPFDVVVVDLVMPGMDGAAVVRALQQIDPKVRVVVASAFGHARVMADIESLQPCGFLRKPFRLAALAEQLSRARSGETDSAWS